jgi:phage shock protein A
MKSKPTSEEITRHKELVRHYQTQIYKLTRQHNYLQKQIERTKAQIKDYEKAKKITER